MENSNKNETEGPIDVILHKPLKESTLSARMTKVIAKAGICPVFTEVYILAYKKITRCYILVNPDDVGHIRRERGADDVQLDDDAEIVLHGRAAVL